MDKKIIAILERVKQVPDFCYVKFESVHTANAVGDTALHVCSIWGDLDAIKALTDAGANINAHGENGFTPLHYAVEFNHFEVVEYLAASGANVFARTEGDTPLQLACLLEEEGMDKIKDFLRKKMTEQSKGDSPHSKHIRLLEQEIASRKDESR